MSTRSYYTKLLLESALTEENPFISTQQVEEWLTERNKAVCVSIEKIRFHEMQNWKLTNDSLSHESGKFFSIDGIKVNTNYGFNSEWEQPIINQPEIGYLGIITKEINGILYFLMQAKIEPGNINTVQLSPTLQATKSNYTQVHKGKRPLYIEIFEQGTDCSIILDQIQSEQGARFLKKRNRNIIIKYEGALSQYDGFIWLTLGQIKKLIQKDNLVNMDTRTVISGISFDNEESVFLKGFAHKIAGEFKKGMYYSAIDKIQALNSFDDILAWFTKLKCKYDLTITKTAIHNLKDWRINEWEIIHKDNKYFKVIAAKVHIDNREVSSWCQPLIQPAQEGLIAFIVKKINGVFHFLVQAKVESGNFDILEMAPTVQCITGNYRETPSNKLPYLDYVLSAKPGQIKFDTLQSEEGGRFFHEQNRNLLIEADDNFNMDLPENYTWLTLNQLITFLKFNNYLNIQSRSLIAAISFI